MSGEARTTRKVRVQCTYEIVIEVDAAMTEEEVKFYVEENGCPGTGSMGAEIDRVMAAAEERGFCWACNVGGECKVLSEPQVIDIPANPAKSRLALDIEKWKKEVHE